MTYLKAAFEETGEQLDRIICYLRRERYIDPKISRFYFSDGSIVEDNIVGTLDNRYSEENVYSETTPRLVRAELGTNVTKIGYEAFMECQSLSALIISDSVSCIEYCLPGTNLHDLYVPSSVVELGDGAFENSNLTAVSLPGTISCLPDYAFSNGSIVNLTFREPGLKIIGNSCFSSNSSYFGSMNLTIPSTIEIIGEDAFLNSNVVEIWFSDKTRVEVVAMTKNGDYSEWGLFDGVVIHCTDGIIVTGD